MEQKKKRYHMLSLLVILTMAMAIMIGMTVAASAETLSGNCGVDGDDGDNVKWTYNTESGALTISGQGEMANFNTWDNYAPWYNYAGNIKSVTISNGVTSIGEYAFKGDYTSLTQDNLTLPDTLTKIARDNQVILKLAEDCTSSEDYSMTLEGYRPGTGDYSGQLLKATVLDNNDNTDVTDELLLSWGGGASIVYQDSDTSTDDPDVEDDGLKVNDENWDGHSVNKYQYGTTFNAAQSIDCTAYRIDNGKFKKVAYKNKDGLIRTRPYGNYTGSDPTGAELKNSLNGLSVTLIEGESVTLGQLLGKAGLTHVNCDCVHIPSIAPLEEEDKNIVEVQEDNTEQRKAKFTGLAAGEVEIVFKAYTYNCSTHGSQGDSDSDKLLDLSLKVIVKGYVAENVQTGKQYVTLQDALDEAATGQTVRLLKDIKEHVTFSDNKFVTLDLDDHGISAAEADRSIITITNGTLTLADNATEKTTHKYSLNEDGVAEFSENGDKSFEGGYIYGAREGENGSMAVHGIQILSQGNLVMNSGTIIGNHSGSEGGGIVVSGYKGYGGDPNDKVSFTMNGGNILGNRSEFGGGISCRGNEGCALTTINGGTISYNRGEQHSGAINVGNNTVINGGIITNNHVEEENRDPIGGAIEFGYGTPSSQLIISGNPKIQNNTRTTSDGITEESNITLSAYSQYGSQYAHSQFTLGNLSDDAKIGVSILDTDEKSLGVFTVGSDPANSTNAYEKGLFTSDHGFYIKVHKSDDALNNQMELADPGFTVTGPEDLTIHTGETGTLIVTAEPKEGNTGGMAYQWYKVTDAGNEPIEGATSKDLTVGEGLDAGTYKYFCKVEFTPTGESSSISIDSKEATVTVQASQPVVVKVEGAATVTLADQIAGTKDYEPTLASEDYSTAAADVTIKYFKKDGDTYVELTEKPTEVGEYRVAVTFKENDRYLAKTVTADYKITAAPEPTPADQVTYDDLTDSEKADADKIVENFDVDKDTAAKMLRTGEELGVPLDTMLLSTKAVKALKDDKDPKGTTFAKLTARAVKRGKTTMRLQWKTLPQADGYLIYANKCGLKYRYKLAKTVKSGKTNKWYRKKLKKQTYYKYLVVAYKNVAGQKLPIGASVTVHCTTKAKKNTIAKAVKLKKTSLTIAKGKTVTLKGKEVKMEAKKIIKEHRGVNYESLNPEIAKVNKKTGKITGVSAGKTTIYVYCQNGVYKKVSVTVK